MKKVNITINPGLGTFDTDVALLDEMYNRAANADTAALDTAIQTATQNGDIWMRTSDLTSTNDGVIFTFILDSADALASFNTNIKPKLEAGLNIMNATYSWTEEDMTFDQFSTFAAANNETNFTGAA